MITEKQQRRKSEYMVQDIEDKRLKLQNELLRKFDDDIYQRILNQYTSPNILDVGCGQGDMLISKINAKKISNFIGIDKSTRQLEVAKIKHKMPNYYFIESDVEKISFEDMLLREMNLRDIDNFEIINISMLLLHLKDPSRLLSVLHRFWRITALLLFVI